MVRAAGLLLYQGGMSLGRHSGVRGRGARRWAPVRLDPYVANAYEPIGRSGSAAPRKDVRSTASAPFAG